MVATSNPAGALSRYATLAGWWLVLAGACAYGQESFAPDAAVPDASTPTTAAVPVATAALPAASTAEKWTFFVDETVTPLTLVAGALDGTASQLTRSAPLYGKHFWRRDAFPKRFGATVGDTVSQNFFADFVLASALHEDTRYIRKGPTYGTWSRIVYAISRAVRTRTDSGDPTFNWANVMGCGMSAGLSNAYYPPVSRTAAVSVVNWGTNIAGAGLTNLMPEFGPEVGEWIKRRLGIRR